MRSIALLSVALVVLGCVQAKQPPPSPTAPEVTVVTVHRQPVPVTTELPGRTSAYLVAQVRARVDGIVLRREFTEGADVKAGQRLYQIARSIRLRTAPRWTAHSLRCKRHKPTSRR